MPEPIIFGLNAVAIFSMISNLFIACAAGITGFCAWQGLSIWKRQHKEINDHDLAVRLATSIYRWREAVKIARTAPDGRPPMLTSDDPAFGNLVEKGDILGRENFDFERLTIIFQNQKKELLEIQELLRVDALISEALWGNELRIIIDKLNELGTKLMVLLESYQQAKNIDRQLYQREAARRLIKKFQDCWFDFKEHPENDTFGKELEDCIKQAEEILKQKMIHKIK